MTTSVPPEQDRRSSTGVPTPAAGSPAPGERGWGKLLLAIAALLFVPHIPQFRAIVPVEQTILLLVPAMAACVLVGWLSGGRFIAVLLWVALATLVAAQPAGSGTTYFTLARGWSLLLAGAFGLVCLFGPRRPFFPRALTALTVALALTVLIVAIVPLTGVRPAEALATEFSRRNSETMAAVRQFIAMYPAQWQELTAKVPQLAALPDETEKQLAVLARVGGEIFPALLALESLAALAVAWAAYHRLARARVGPPLSPLREFRFNDQLVWGLIVGIATLVLPTLAYLQTVGKNLLVFFGALYALRGLGVLAWFLAPGALVATVTIGFAMLWWPVLNVVAVLGFLLLVLAAFGLGLGDTWADWRRRARPTP